MHYWDTSTLAKLYVSESDSAQFVEHLAATGPTVSSELARWEIFRVFARKEAEQAITPGAAEILFAKFEADVESGRVTLLPMSREVERRYQEVVLKLHRQTPPIFTRTLDAIHLATSDIAEAVELVATDLNLRKCARVIGLKFFPPP
jgi:predicted nucleic acid-binding protein